MKNLLSKIWLGQVGLLLISLALGLSTISFYFQSFAQSRGQLLDQVRTREILLSRASTNSIQSFFKNAEDQLILLSYLPDIAAANSAPSPTIKNLLITPLTSPVSQIARFDQSGKLLFILDRAGPPASLSGTIVKKELSAWTKLPANKGNIYISTPYVSQVGSVSGKYAVSLAIPLYQDSLYTGSLALVISVSDFDKIFIVPLGKNVSEEVFILNLDGTVVAGPSSLQNLNLFAYAQKKNWPQSKQFSRALKKALTTTELATSWTFVPPTSKTGELMLVTARLIDVPRTDNNLYLVVTYPVRNITQALVPLYSFGNSWLRLGAYSTFAGGLIILAARIFLTQIIRRKTKDNGATF